MGRLQVELIWDRGAVQESRHPGGDAEHLAEGVCFDMELDLKVIGIQVGYDQELVALPLTK